MYIKKYVPTAEKVRFAKDAILEKNVFAKRI